LSFSKAAAKLYISQPTLSRNISLLEKELQVQLFTRSSFQGTQLTQAGSCLVSAFTQARDIMRSAVRQAQSIAQQKVYCLTLGLLEGQMMDEGLCQLLQQLKDECGNVQVDMVKDSFHPLIHRLKNDELDVILTMDYDLSGIPDIHIQPFCTLPTLLIIPRSFLDSPEADTIYSLADFSSLPFICTCKDDSPVLIDMLYRACGEAGFTPNIKFVDSLHEEALTLEMGLGIAGLNPNHAIFHSPNIRAVPVREFEPQTFSLAWKRDAANPAVGMFARAYSTWSKSHRSPP